MAEGSALLAQSSWAWANPIFATVFAFVALLLILVVLLQRGRGGGLTGALGGGGGATAAFGSKTGDVLTWATIVIAGMFIVFAVMLNYWFRPASISPIVPPTQPASSAATPPEAGTEAPAPLGEPLTLPDDTTTPAEPAGDDTVTDSDDSADTPSNSDDSGAAEPPANTDPGTDDPESP